MARSSAVEGSLQPWIAFRLLFGALALFIVEIDAAVAVVVDAVAALGSRLGGGLYGEKINGEGFIPRSAARSRNNMLHKR